MLLSIHMTFSQQDATHAVYVGDHPHGFFKLFVPLKTLSGSAPSVITVTTTLDKATVNKLVIVYRVDWVVEKFKLDKSCSFGYVRMDGSGRI